MGHVSLIPAERLIRRRRKARLYLWTAVCGAYTILLVGGSLTLRVLHATEGRNVKERLATVTREIEQDSQTMLKLRRELAEATAVLETARAIHAQPDWSRLFMGLSDQLGEEIVICRCRLVTLSEDEKIIAEPWGESSPPKPLSAFFTACRHRLTLAGFGKTQESVSRFVLRLEGVGAFDLVRLTSSSRQSFLDGEAVAFMIECHF